MRNFPAAICSIFLLLGLACSDDNNPSGLNSTVTDPFPLALGNSWEYTLVQDAFINRDTTILDTTVTYILHLSSQGSQRVSISRTEAITGDEAFGVRHFHEMNFVFSVGADTTEETHFLARRGERIMLKAIEYGYNTGGSIPLAIGPAVKQRLLGKVSSGGRTRYVPLERLAQALLNPEPTEDRLSSNGPSLASDGIQNNENAWFYGDNYLLLFNELYKGRAWISSAAESVGGLEISRRVTNVLDGLSGYEGPIAEVEETNSLVESTGTTSYKLRFYYKGGVGIVQAELSDTDFDFYVLTEDGIDFLGTGAWQVIKKLERYTVK